MFTILNISDLKVKMHKYNEVKLYAQESLQLSQKIGDTESTILALRGLGIYYLHQNQYIEAKKNTLQSLKIAKKHENLEHQYKAYNLLSEIATASQDLTLADDYSFSSDSIETIINMDEVRSKIEDIKEKYQTEKKELQIKNLTSQNQVKSLENNKRFWIAIGLSFALLGLGIFAYTQFKNFKTKKALLIAQQNNAITEERLRIATDMHDDVGTGLSRIRYIASAVATGQTAQDVGLKKVTEISDDAVQKMREIIWSLNESNQNLEELIYFIRRQISEVVENSDMNFICRLPDNIPEVFFGWKRNRNTYLLVKESVNNAIKHSEAKNIAITFTIAEDLHIVVSDDGKGFDTTQKSAGNGLDNYKKRIEALNGFYDITSTKDKGTTLSFHIPT
jgi:two-component system, NarL family, sensor kinase